MLRSRRPTQRAVDLLLVIAIAVAIAACGSDDDPGNEAGSSSTTDAQTTTDSRPGTETSGGSAEEQVTTIVQGMYRDLAAGDEAGVCAVMSTAARRQIARNAPSGAKGDGTCEGSMGEFLDAAATSGVLTQTANAKVRGVKIDGRFATATVEFGPGAKGDVKLLREDGDWRFGAGAVVGPGARSAS